MQNFYNRATIAEEAKVLFSIADEADQLGLIRNAESLARWRHVKQRIDKTGYGPETEFLFTLLCEIDGNGALSASPLKDRWLPVKTRIDNAPRRMYPRPS